MNKQVAFDGVTPLNPDAVAIPCGLVAQAFFNDTFQISQNQKQVQIQFQNLAWDIETDKKFKNQQRADWDTVQWTDIQDCK